MDGYMKIQGFARLTGISMAYMSFFLAVMLN